MDQNIKLDKEIIDQLVQKAKTDERTFEQLYEYYFPKIYGFVFKRVGNQQICEDLVSDIFLKTLANLEKYESRGFSFSCWIYKIANNQIIDYYRQKNKNTSIDLDKVENVLPDKLNQEVELGNKMEVEKIRQIIGNMPENYQQVLSLKFFSELNNPEIAQIVGETENNVGVLLHRALKRFREIYDK